MAGVVRTVLPALRTLPRAASSRLSWTTHTASRGIKRWVAPTLRTLKKRQEKQGPQPVQPRSTYLEWNYDAELFAFGARLGETFDEALLRRAFTHRSYIVREQKRQEELGVTDVRLDLPDNQELAKTGTTLLQQYIKKYLRAALPYFPEEGIQSIYNYLSSVEVLADISFHLGTKDLILSDQYPPERATLSATFEAVVGALDISSGRQRAEIFVRDVVLTRLSTLDINDLWEVTDPVGALAGILRREGRGEPMPRLLWQAAPNTLLATYLVGIYSDKKLLGTGPGETVEIAQEMAARDSLRRMFCTDGDMAPLPLGSRAEQIDITSAPVSNISVKEWTHEKVLNNVARC